MWNYSEGLVSLDKDNNWIPCLAEDWRWVDDMTIEFMLRRGVTFHNGDKFDAEAVRINWESYREMKSPRLVPSTALPDETQFRILDDYTVRFVFSEPDGMAFSKFLWFFQIAPSFLKEHNFAEKNWGELPEPGPWGTGPFKLVEGGNRLAKQTDRIVLDAYQRYWDRRYPKIQRAIFDNALRNNREEAMRRCREAEGDVDVVSFIRPLDTLKVAKSPFARVIKSRASTILAGMFNQRKANSKWRDIRLRKAVNYAVNRRELWKYAAKGNAYNVEGFPVPPGAFGSDPSWPKAVYDVAKAKSLIADAGYPNGFDMTIITLEAHKLEAKIMSSMLERIGLNVKVEIVTLSEFFQKFFVSFLDKPPEEQEWDFEIGFLADVFGHTAATFLNYGFLEESDTRWIEYDSKFEKMWKDMAQTVDSGAQEEKIRHIVHYLYDRTYDLTIYSPLLLYAVNKEVNFVPQKSYWLRLKESSVTENHWSIRGKSN